MFDKIAQIMGLFKNLPKIQEESQKFQQGVGQITADGEAGGGMVKVKVNGRREILKCEISEGAIGDRELLEDLIKAAANQALQKVQVQVMEQWAKMAANLGLPPGAAGGMGMLGLM